MNAMNSGRRAMIAAAASILNQMRAEEAECAALAARGAERLRARQAALHGRAPVVETWTPDRVGAALVEALRWAHRAAGRVGPGGMVSARLPEAILSLEDHAAEGWGLPEVADPDDLPPMRVQLTPQQVSFNEAALNWPAVYLCPDHAGSARIVGLWAACKVYRRPFEDAIKARYSRMVARDGAKAQREWGMSRATAFRLRDRGLSIISVGLDRDGVSLHS